MEVANREREVQKVNIDPQGWVTITDAMSNVVTPEGTAGSAHLSGIDFAGKTGSAQVVSNALRRAVGMKASQYRDNSWFVGVTPRRNPDIVVAVLFEGGEHGQFAARLAAQVIHAWVEKQRRIRNDNNYAAVDKEGHPIELTGIWNEGSTEEGTQRLNGANFQLAANTPSAKPVDPSTLLMPPPAIPAKVH
jgi:penicillin-binding protein 2